MKKVLLVAVVGVFMLGLTSCKKDWTCYCKSNNVPEISQATYQNTTKSAATDACTAYETNYKIIEPTADCTVK